MSEKSVPVGELRPSQLLHTFGIGAVVDLPHISAMIMGLDEWQASRCRTIREDRLLAEVRHRLGPQVERLATPPMGDDEREGFRPGFDEASTTGVPVAPFPRWLRCPGCGLISPLSSGLFRLDPAPGRPSEVKYYHSNCSKLTKPTVLPARFLVACERGHLDDFPWSWFVHKGGKECPAQLELRELGISGEAADLEVGCRGCTAKRRMADAFGEEGPGNLPSCRARRPHLRDFEDEPCTSALSAILLGASNSWFDVSLSTLYVPRETGAQIDQLVEERWSELADVDGPGVLAFLRKQTRLGPLAEFPDAAVMEAIERRRSPSDHASEDIKTPEWRVFSQPDPKRNGPDFLLREEKLSGRWPWLARVVLAERLREVSALIGFTRIGSPRDFAESEDVPSSVRVPLSRTPPTLVPAAEVRGEGIFLQFDETRLSAWCDRQRARDEAFHVAHTAWRTRRDIEHPEAGFPGIRHILLHSFAHALMRELCLECGYTAASLRERIYARDESPDGPAMAGLLIYTAAPDSEGTLGGLVRLGRASELDRHIDRALDQMRLCSSDPLCADHAPEPDGATLHGAACHACLFAPETSCERGNKYLDRTLLVETVAEGRMAFFSRS